MKNPKSFFNVALEEKLYGLSNPQGNHGEDVKERCVAKTLVPGPGFLFF